MELEVRAVRSPGEVVAAGQVTVEANAEYVPASPTPERLRQWTGYLEELADAATRAREGTLLVAVDPAGTVVGTATLYLAPTPASEHWRDGDAMLRMLAVAPAARGRGVGRALFEECLRLARAAARPRMALHTTEWMAVARSMYERAGFAREPEGDIHLDGLVILAYARDL